MKYLSLLLLFTSLCSASELVQKAQLVEEILAQVPDSELISVFEKTSVLGSSLQSIRTHHQDPDALDTLDSELATIIRDAVGTSAMETFTVPELEALKTHLDGSEAERSLSIKALNLTISQNPKAMQKFSKVFMNFSQGAFQKVRKTSQEKAIMNNLRQIASAADQYFLENGETSVEVKELIGPNSYIKRIRPVADETYPQTVSTSDEELTATLPNGETISMDF